MAKGAPILVIRVLIARSFFEAISSGLEKVSHFGNTPIHFSSSKGNEKGNQVPNVDPVLNQFTLDANALAERDTSVHGSVASPQNIAFKPTNEVTVRDQSGTEVLTPPASCDN